eukprot:scaffold3118_cov60-Attheya_sp.AAC.6
MRMRSGLVCCRQRPAWVSWWVSWVSWVRWVNWVVVLVLLSDLGPLSYRAQANELHSTKTWNSSEVWQTGSK